MNKQMPLIIGGVVILAVLGVVAFTQLKKPSAGGSEMKSEESSEVSGQDTLKSILMGGKNIKCNVKYDDSNMSGMMYSSTDKKTRFDFKSQDASGKEMDGHVIYDGTYGYFWSSAATQGTKMKIENLEEYTNPSPGTDQSNQSVDWNKDVDTDCSSWSVDNSVFTPPSNVEFMDLSSMMQMGTSSPGTGTTPAINKGICDQITDPQAKASCLQYAQ